MKTPYGERPRRIVERDHPTWNGQDNTHLLSEPVLGDDVGRQTGGDGRTGHRLPRLLDCRAIYLEQSLADAGVNVTDVRELSLWGGPVAVAADQVSSAEPVTSSWMRWSWWLLLAWLCGFRALDEQWYSRYVVLRRVPDSIRDQRRSLIIGVLVFGASFGSEPVLRRTAGRSITGDRRIPTIHGLCDP